MWCVLDLLRIIEQRLSPTPSCRGDRNLIGVACLQVCTPLSAELAERFELPPMVPPSKNTEKHATAFTVSIDYKQSGDIAFPLQSPLHVRPSDHVAETVRVRLRPI